MAEEDANTRRDRSRHAGRPGRLAARLREDAGQSLILIVLAMALIVVLAAFAIDVAQWQVGHHKAQVTADAAALAAANCLASTVCTSTASGGDAAQRADAIANDNGFPNSSVTLSFTSSTVKATISTSSRSVFAGFAGLTSASVSASAVASYDTNQGLKWNCSSNCLSLFAGNPKCPASGTTDVGLTLVTDDSGGGNEDITGLYTNGYYYNGAASGSYSATDVAPGCGNNYEKKPNDTTFSTVSSVVPYPATWQQPACTDTAASWTTATISGGGVYCVSSAPAAGACDNGGNGGYTGAGSITVDLSALPAGAYEFVGPCVNLSGSQAATVTNISGQPLVYGTSNISTYATSGSMPTCSLNDGSSGTSTWLTGNNATLNGMVYDQCGTFEVTGNSVSLDGFVEAWNIVTNKNGSVVGTGPSSPSNPQVTNLPGTDALTG